MYTAFIKPFFDRLTALIILVAAIPILLPVIFLLAMANQGKVWFLQERPGRDNKVFKVIKFKTMNDARDAGGLLPDESRLTAVGNFIRKTSLDELPQLINVLKGDMSIVGPRPLLMEYLPLYSEEQLRRHDQRKGPPEVRQLYPRSSLAPRAARLDLPLHAPREVLHRRRGQSVEVLPERLDRQSDLERRERERSTRQERAEPLVD